MSNVLPIGALGGARVSSDPIDRMPMTTMPRLLDMIVDPSPERMALQLKAFRASVQDALSVSSKAYCLLVELEKADLADCVPCTAQLRSALAGNPHYVVLKKLEEAERLLSNIDHLMPPARG